jgi:hypothetical protein
MSLYRKTFRGEDRMYHLHCEPPIDEILHDPATQLLMKRDGVDEATLRRLLEQVGRRIFREPGPAIA